MACEWFECRTQKEDTPNIVHPILLYILFLVDPIFYILFLVHPIFGASYLCSSVLSYVVPFISVSYFCISYLVLPIFEVPVPKSEVPNFDLSYVRYFLLLRSYLCVFLFLCYPVNGVAPFNHSMWLSGASEVGFAKHYHVHHLKCVHRSHFQSGFLN